MTSPEDAAHLRRAFALAGEARARGDEAFGAVLLAADGVLLTEAGNRVSTAGDPTAHAEMAAIRDAAAAHGAERLSYRPALLLTCSSVALGDGRQSHRKQEVDF